LKVTGSHGKNFRSNIRGRPAEQPAVAPVEHPAVAPAEQLFVETCPTTLRSNLRKGPAKQPAVAPAEQPELAPGEQAVCITQALLGQRPESGPAKPGR
jgi:hypothetical protein